MSDGLRTAIIAGVGGVGVICMIAVGLTVVIANRRKHSKKAQQLRTVTVAVTGELFAKRLPQASVVAIGAPLALQLVAENKPPLINA
jgi:hypothetical protein